MLVEVHLIVDKAWDLARISGDILPEDRSLYGEYKCSALNCSFDDSHRRLMEMVSRFKAELCLNFSFSSS